MTEKEVRAIARDEYAKIEAERAKLPASEWAAPYIQAAVDHGLVTENAAGSIDRPPGGGDPPGAGHGGQRNL